VPGVEDSRGTRLEGFIWSELKSISWIVFSTTVSTVFIREPRRTEDEMFNLEELPRGCSCDSVLTVPYSPISPIISTRKLVSVGGVLAREMPS